MAALWQKCRQQGQRAQFSHTDNMALVGALSTQLLYRQLVRNTPESSRIVLKTKVDRLEGRQA
jgi:asparagine synthase (glutamine-hydrolysing)